MIILIIRMLFKIIMKGYSVQYATKEQDIRLITRTITETELSGKLCINNRQTGMRSIYLPPKCRVSLKDGFSFNRSVKRYCLRDRD